LEYDFVLDKLGHQIAELIEKVKMRCKPATSERRKIALGKRNNPDN